MDTKVCSGLVFALLLTLALPVRAADEAVVVKEAAVLLEQIASDPEIGIPHQSPREASCILIMPHVVETRLGMGRKRGCGLFLSRDEHGDWGDPEPVEISSVSAGAEVGRQTTDTVIIFRTCKAAEKFGETPRKLTLSVGAVVSLRRRHRFEGPSSDSDEEVLVYEQYRGLRVGAAISGERRWGPFFTAKDRKTERTGETGAAEGKAQVTAARDASKPASETTRVSASPDTVRLKRVLTALTSPSPARVAATEKKDMKFTLAGGATRVPATSAPLR
jgi:lipid-binding SYLF domain-containing protein